MEDVGNILQVLAMFSERSVDLDAKRFIEYFWKGKKTAIFFMCNELIYLQYQYEDDELNTSSITAKTRKDPNFFNDFKQGLDSLISDEIRVSNGDKELFSLQINLNNGEFEEIIPKYVLKRPDCIDEQQIDENHIDYELVKDGNSYKWDIAKPDNDRITMLRQDQWQDRWSTSEEKPQKAYWGFRQGTPCYNKVNVKYYSDGSFYQEQNEPTKAFDEVSELISPFTAHKHKKKNLPKIHIVFYNVGSRPSDRGAKILRKLKGVSKRELVIAVIVGESPGTINSYKSFVDDFLFIPYTNELPSDSRLLLLSAIFDGRPVRELCKLTHLTLPKDI